MIKNKIDLKSFILPTTIDNMNANREFGDPDFRTKDLIFLESLNEIQTQSIDAVLTSATDYALINNARQIDGLSSFWLRSRALTSLSKHPNIKTVSCDGYYSYEVAYNNHIGLCPTMHLNLNSFISALNMFSNFSKISPVRATDGKTYYHTLTFGEYPKSHVENDIRDKLELCFLNRSLTETGKVYTGSVNENGTFSKHREYFYNDEKYVRVKIKNYKDYSIYSDGTKIQETGTYTWVKVEPIIWEIKNWNELPKEINSSGSGKAKSILVRTEEVIMAGIPFYPYFLFKFKHKNCTMWQNSTVRGFLNGINVNNIKTNGNTKFTAPIGGDFSQNGNFLNEAFDYATFTKLKYSSYHIEKSFSQEFSAEQIYSKSKKQSTEIIKFSRLKRINPDKTPENLKRKMTDTEIIKSWIDAGQSVLLRGPSGIGKTERIIKLYPNLIYIKLTNNMFPEKVVGSLNLQTGQVIPPDFAKQALLEHATDEEKELIKENVQNLFDFAQQIYDRSKKSESRIVILLDELLNVKPAIQSLVYSLVLNNLIEIGKGLKLPANTVVVATGNQKKYSVAAEDLAEPLEKRFDHIYDMEPKVSEWIYEYAIPNKLHPSVIGYIFLKFQQSHGSEAKNNIEYFYEDPEIGENYLDKNGCRGRTNDPRSWTSISTMLYAFEKDLLNGKFIGKDVQSLLKTSINSKLREKWATDFFNFYNSPILSIDEIVEKKYTQSDLPKDISEKFATMANLLSADESQIEIVRNFIRKYCDPEYLSVYDIYWAGHDEKRIEKIAELQEINRIDKEIEKNL